MSMHHLFHLQCNTMHINCRVSVTAVDDNMILCITCSHCNVDGSERFGSLNLSTSYNFILVFEQRFRYSKKILLV